MKRSKALSLILMGSMVLGGAGCGSEKADENMYTFTSLDECVTSALFSEAECRELAKNALAQSPRFNNKEECEAQFGEGACENGPAQRQADGTVHQGSGSMWMPMMMGFMAGRFLGGGGMMQGSQGLYRDNAQTQQPGTRSFRTAGGDQVQTDSRGRVNNPSSRLTQSMQHNAKPVMSRTGSGAKSGGFSGGSSYGGGAS